ncbi:unnamed protein product [Blumeria hordei]|uniref:Fungal-type protein kinase domain-containing protein n=1 Tax=Blumeria hordei TaxID=2867405 RepID=A0A383US90_BLUHO|nr:unnamed protein product [Blumeria hordei]
MSNYSTILEALAKKPLRPILEDFQTNRSTAGSLSEGRFYFHVEGNETNRSAFKRFFCILQNEYMKLFRGQESLMMIPLMLAGNRLMFGQIDESIFNHLVCAIEQGYDEAFILQTSINLAGTIINYMFPPLPFRKNPSSTFKSSNSALRNVPVGFWYFPASPTKHFEKEFGNQSYTCILKFWDRFFEGKDWSDQTKRIWESYKNYKNDSNPKNIRFNLAEQGVYDWLASFNNLFLKQVTEPLWPPSEYFPTLIRDENDVPLRGIICLLTSIKRLISYKDQGQLDFHIRCINPPEGSGDWEDVRVVAGFSSKPAKDRRKAKFIEMAAYVSEIFRRQPLRRFVHGFCLFDKEIEFWLIDRTGAFSSGLISIEDDEKTREIEIDPKPLTQPRELLSNGTTCYRSLDDKLLVKYSWRKICGKSEIDFLKEALPVKGVINLVASDTIHRFSDHWENISSLRPKRWHLAKEKQFLENSDNEDESYKTSELSDYELNRVVLSPYGRPLKSCRSVLQFLIVMRDAIMGHQRLYNEKKITHGDISHGNIIIVTPTEEDRSRGMLIDFDNSLSMHDEFLWEKEYFFAGTIKYMACEVLQCHAEHRSGSMIDYLNYHNYDLQSFFYVFLTGCVEYGRDRDQRRCHLEQWNTDNMHVNLDNKKDDMKRNFKNLVGIKFSSSFIDVKELAFELHKILFGIFRIKSRNFILVDSLHNEMILALNRTIGQIEAGKIPNRMWTD